MGADLVIGFDLTPRKYFTRKELLNRVWGAHYVGDTRRVDMYISNLREKLTRACEPPVGYGFEL